MAEQLHFSSGDRPLSGYLVRPEVSDGNAPGVLVIHEILGLTDGIRAVADRFAHAGYVALAVDLFAGQSRAVCMARMLAGGWRDPLDHQGVRDTRRALEVLGGLPGVDPERLGAIGFCLGERSPWRWPARAGGSGPSRPTTGSIPARRRPCAGVARWWAASRNGT